MSATLAMEPGKKMSSTSPARGLVLAHRGLGPTEATGSKTPHDQLQRGVPLQSGFGMDFSRIHVHPPSLATDNQSLQPTTESCPLALATPRACPFGGLCHTCPTRVQTKLAINQPGDEYEQEADRVAEQVMGTPESSVAPIQVSPARHRAVDWLQRWDADTHEKITTLAGNRVLSDRLFVWQVSRHSAMMDVTAKRLLWTGPRFLLGIEKGEGPEHGEDGNYSNPSVSAARAQNVREQNARRDVAVRHHRECEALRRRGEPVHRMGTVAGRIFRALGDACHIAQDRGSHGEGVRGKGHDDPRTERGWNPDDKGDNSVGYGEAVANTVDLFEQWQRLTASETTSGVLRRRAASQATPAVAPPLVSEVLCSPGDPLDAATRGFMESRFGQDFSNVRVHTDSRATEAAQAVNARAFTLGHDIVFSAGQYAPETEVGKRLLTHELTHVVQQAHGGASSKPEQRADATAARVAQGDTVSPAFVGGALQSVQMKPDDPSRQIVEDKPTEDPNSWSETLDRFAHNSPTLTREHHGAIDALAAAIAARVGLVAGAKATITVTGHTDTSGDEKYNEDLGLKRASAAKVALEAALTKKNISTDRIAAITTESAGEKRLAKETADNVREPLNRRADITVKIEGPRPAVSTAPTTRSPRPEPSTKKKTIDLNLPPDYALPEETWWERTERERKRIEELDRKYARGPRSLTDVLVEAVTNVLEPIIRELPESLRGKAREGIRKGIEAGTEKACEAMIDAIGVPGKEAKALKTACKAAIKAKPRENK